MLALKVKSHIHVPLVVHFRFTEMIVSYCGGRLNLYLYIRWAFHFLYAHPPPLALAFVEPAFEI